ncbi:hypothetical protein [Undibacterium sp.]|uniref:hypothetical protein n=1 Tax=Undibacterium sp. TaxID=1914977 RepID=UPI002B599E74|nr:hypothetical protein [Undibacterium sp.]HTD04968.1 hypothetical protein [Undibacterium sp.]
MMIAAGMSLLGPVSSWADEPAGNSIAMTPDGLASQDQHQQEAAYEPTRIVLRDASFGFNFIALLPRQEKKQADPPRIVALLDKPWTAVGEGRLDESRGGFDAGGLVLSFGIERAVYVDGNLVTTTSFNVSDVGKITSDQMKTLSAQAAAMGLVQNGPGNTFQLTSGAASLPGTVIQNTLNNQSIKTLTIINATSNSLNLIKGINTLNTLSNVINSSINGH